jgi:hypothetical protein
LAILDRIKVAWNAFRNVDLFQSFNDNTAPSYGRSPSRNRLRVSNERTIIASVYNKLSIDVAGVLIKHAQLDEKNRYTGDVDSKLNSCLTYEPNMDQSPRQFRQDIALALFDKGVAAIVPVDTTIDPMTGQLFDVFSMRVGEVVTWYPNHVRVCVYNEKVGQRQEIVLEKRVVAIVENPLYAVMNEPNSTLQRLIRKLSLLDAVDEQSGSGKLDIIIQLPYVVKSEARKAQAEQRRTDIEFQLRGVSTVSPIRMLPKRLPNLIGLLKTIC